MKKIRNNKKVKPKRVNGEIIREIKIAYFIQKTNSSEENEQRYRQGKLGKLRDYGN